MTKAPYPTEDELHAFVDDELSASRQAEIASVLRDEPALAQRVAAYRADRERLRSALRGIAEEPIPTAWISLIKEATERRHRAMMTRRLAIAASVGLVVSAGAIAGWRWLRRDTILAEAEAARDGRLTGRTTALVEPLPPVAERDTRLQSALGMHVRVPNLNRFGFQLARLDLFDGRGGVAAQLEYQDSGHRVLTIYVRPSDGNVRFDLLQRDGTRVCVWQDDVVGAVIIAPMPAGEMLRIAASAYADLNL